MYLRKTKLESEIEKLKREIKELREQKEKLTKELKYIFELRYPILGPIRYTGSIAKELQITKIVFDETKGESYCTYYYDSSSYLAKFTEVGAGNGLYLNREDAEKTRELYLKEKEEENLKRIIKRYEESKRNTKKS
jgi:hypothetical protein